MQFTTKALLATTAVALTALTACGGHTTHTITHGHAPYVATGHGHAPSHTHVTVVHHHHYYVVKPKAPKASRLRKH